MSVYDLARELGQQLLDTPETIAVLEAKKVFEADEKAVALINEFKVLQMQYQQKLQNPQLTKEEYESLTNEIREKSDVINSYPATAKLIEAEQTFNNLLNQIFTIVTSTIAGDDPQQCGSGDCSSDCCSSCSGCH